MTEITDKIDGDGFVFALIIAPFAVSVMVGIPLLISPIFGLVVICAPAMGFMAYIAIGGPLLWLSLKFRMNNPIAHVVLALISVSLIAPLARLGIPLINDPDLIVLGYYIAPLWAVAFGWLYGKLTHTPYFDIPD